MSIISSAEWWFRHAITYPVLSRVFRNTPHGTVIDLRTVRSVLVLRYDRFGDMLLTSPILRHLKAVNPDATVGVAASEANAVVASHLPGVDNVHIVRGRPTDVLRGIAEARAARYDVVLNFIFNRTTTGGILANLMSPDGIKVGQGAEKYGFYFNRLLSVPRGEMHMASLLDRICRDVFGPSWGTPDLRYDVREEASSAARVSAWRHAVLTKTGPEPGYCVVNLSAGEARRNPDISQVEIMVRYLLLRLAHTVVLVSAPGDQSARLRLQQRIGSRRVVSYPPAGSGPFMDMISLIRRAAFLVSPDTSLVHAACATGRPVMSIYASAEEFAEWAPIGVPYEAVIPDGNGGVPSIAGDRLTSALQRFLEVVRRTEGAR